MSIPPVQNPDAPVPHGRPPWPTPEELALAEEDDGEGESYPPAAPPSPAESA